MFVEESILGASYVPFEELIATSDVISVNCPLTPETRGILDDAAFAKMKDGVYIVNTARVGHPFSRLSSAPLSTRPVTISLTFDSNVRARLSTSPP